MIYVFDTSTGAYEGTRDDDGRRPLVAGETRSPPPVPVFGAVCRWVGDEWTLSRDPSLVADFRAMSAAVNVERARRLDDLTVNLDGARFDADAESRANLQGILAASAAGVPIPWPLAWRCTDNSVRELDQGSAAMLAGLMLSAVQGVYAASWYIKDAVIPAIDAAGFESFKVADDRLWTVPVAGRAVAAGRTP